jgi:hypothetical protein
VRGGAWNNNRDNARPSIRNNNNPNNDWNNNGFRPLVFHGFADCQQCAPVVANRRSTAAEAKLAGLRPVRLEHVSSGQISKRLARSSSQILWRPSGRGLTCPAYLPPGMEIRPTSPLGIIISLNTNNL